MAKPHIPTDRVSAKTPRSLFDACRALDDAEACAWDRRGGPSNKDHTRIAAIEAEIGDRPADCLEVVLWRAGRLTRAIANGWREHLPQALAKSVERDLRAIATQ